MQHYSLHIDMWYFFVTRCLIEVCAADSYDTLVWWKLPKSEEPGIQFVTLFKSSLRDTGFLHRELLMLIRWFLSECFLLVAMKHLC